MDMTFSYLMSTMIISILGFALFLYGKKAGKIVPLVAGIAIGVVPYFFANLAAIWIFTIVALVPVWKYRHN
jgi:hypothetical protein